MHGAHGPWWMWFWWLWLIFILTLLLLPMGYGWGLRGWGPPVPTYWRSRRAQAGGPVGAPPVTQGGWGSGADLVWIAFFIAVLWLAVLFFWW